MKNLKKVLALVLLIAVLVSAFALQGFAAGARNPEAYLPYSPAAEGEVPFTDVAEDSWYYDAVNWAYQNKIVSGVTARRFAPDCNVSRQDFTTMHYRYAKLEGFVEEKSFGLLERFGFKDVRSVSAYALESLRWAAEKGILNGVNSTSVDPLGRLTRAQCAALIMRFDKNIYTA